jgi:hypothetical protein
MWKEIESALRGRATLTRTPIAWISLQQNKKEDNKNLVTASAADVHGSNQPREYLSMASI